MSTPSKSNARPQAPTKDQLRAMLAEAVRNTQPELNPGTDKAPGAKIKARARPTKAAPAKPVAKRRKDRF